jgi:micrococcal nuclease
MKKILLVIIIFLYSCSIGIVEGPYIVSNVVDGDTLDVDLGRIRLSGINTPETGECYYQEAKEALSNLTLDKEVYLEQDYENYDKYGRLLKYIYVDNVSVNAFLVENGYAKVFDKYNATTKRYYEYKELEKVAQDKKLGVWNCTTNEGCLYVASKKSKVYHSPDCKWAKRIKPENLICFHSEEELNGYKKSSSC